MDLNNLSPSSYQLSEEVARWRFELDIRSNENWWIAFTNPTAGPWKRLEGLNADGKRGEVLRFERESDRPDLVLVCDAFRTVVIIEAKDSLAQLAVKKQIEKSCAVVAAMRERLSQKQDNQYWGERARYAVIPGILWGRQHAADQSRLTAVAGAWISKLGQGPFVGVEVVQDAGGSLTCSTHWHIAPSENLPSFHPSGP